MEDVTSDVSATTTSRKVGLQPARILLLTCTQTMTNNTILGIEDTVHLVRIDERMLVEGVRVWPPGGALHPLGEVAEPARALRAAVGRSGV